MAWYASGVCCASCSVGVLMFHRAAALFKTRQVQFWNSLAKVPAGAQLVMMFGEIDCREGMLVRVQRSHHPSTSLKRT
jgi:hypothetical protein